MAGWASGRSAQDRPRAEPREVPQRCPAGRKSSGQCVLKWLTFDKCYYYYSTYVLTRWFLRWFREDGAMCTHMV